MQALGPHVFIWVIQQRVEYVRVNHRAEWMAAQNNIQKKQYVVSGGSEMAREGSFNSLFPAPVFAHRGKDLPKGQIKFYRQQEKQRKRKTGMPPRRSRASYAAYNSYQAERKGKKETLT